MTNAVSPRFSNNRLAIFFDRATSASTARSVAVSVSTPSSSRSMVSLPYRPTVSVMSTVTLCGIANLE